MQMTQKVSNNNWVTVAATAWVKNILTVAAGAFKIKGMARGARCREVVCLVQTARGEPDGS